LPYIFVITFHSLTSLSSENAAFAGLVDGSLTAGIPVAGKIYLVYILCDSAALFIHFDFVIVMEFVSAIGAM
jgi:hypothetical protein